MICEIFTKFCISTMNFLLVATLIQISIQTRPMIKNARYCYETVGVTPTKYLATDSDPRVTQAPEHLVVTTSVEIHYTENGQEMVDNAFTTDVYKLISTSCTGTLYLSRNNRNDGKMYFHIIISTGQNQMIIDEAIGSFESTARLGTVQISSTKGIFLLFLRLKNDLGILKSSGQVNVNQELRNFPWKTYTGQCLMVSAYNELFTINTVSVPSTNSLPSALAGIKFCVYNNANVFLCKPFVAWRVTCPDATSLIDIRFLIGIGAADRQVAMLPIGVGLNPLNDPTGSYFTQTGSTYFTVVKIRVLKTETSFARNDLPFVELFDFDVQSEEIGTRIITRYKKDGTELPISMMEVSQYVLDSQGQCLKWEFIKD